MTSPIWQSNDASQTAAFAARACPRLASQSADAELEGGANALA